MEIQYTDYNNANTIISNTFSLEWAEITETLNAIPLFLKSSDQKGIKGRLNFDPVATNEYLQNELESEHWSNKIRIPQRYNPLGTDVDFGKRNVILEVQFSNYPFLINNLIRSELFFKSSVELIEKMPIKLLIIITKSKMFPSANSSLYYEQAKNQMDFLSQKNIFSIPLRLVGLFSKLGNNIATWSKYSSTRYSRNVVQSTQISCKIELKESGLGIITKQ